MPNHCTLYAPVDAAGRFLFAKLSQKKREVSITESEKKYGGLTVRPISMTLLQDASNLPECDADTWASKHAGWIIQNFDDTFWMDTLSQSEADTRAWWGNGERAAKREAFGYKVVRVVLEADAKRY